MPDMAWARAMRAASRAWRNTVTPKPPASRIIRAHGVADASRARGDWTEAACTTTRGRSTDRLSAMPSAESQAIGWGKARTWRSNRNARALVDRASQAMRSRFRPAMATVSGRGLVMPMAKAIFWA